MTLGEHLLGDAETVLRREAEKLRGGSPLDRLLVGWLLPNVYGSEANALAADVVRQWRETKRGGEPRSYQAVGALALASTLDVEDAERREAFCEGLDWALGTSVEVDGASVGLAADPAAILAVATAVVRSGGQARQQVARAWLASVIDRFGARLDTWERAQLYVASQFLGDLRTQPPELHDVSCVTRIALAPAAEVVAPSDAKTIVAAVLEYYTEVDPIGAALLLASLKRTKATVVRSIRTEAMNVDDVVALLRNITRSFRDWTWEEKSRTKTTLPRQWHVDHEYHVQNLLWVVLAPLFPDVESENYSSKVGFTQPRADLTIPSLKLIVEAKFARATDTMKEIQRQLAQDAAMYFPQGGQYDRMIAFVWDDAARTEEHATFIQGLEKLDRVTGVVVVSRPAKMRQQPGVARVDATGGIGS